jgi:hypothetical protein
VSIDWSKANKQRQALRQALEKVYPSANDLRRFASEELNENLATVAGEGKLEDLAFNLIEWALKEGRLDKLYQAFCRDNQGNLWIAKLKEDLQDPEQKKIIGEKSSKNWVIRDSFDDELVEDLRSTHLVIAIFWQQNSKQKLRVCPKFCYRSANNREILCKNLVEDGCSVVLKDFPEFLKKLVDCTMKQKYFTELNELWELTIELFVPVDLLCQPLVTWCGQSDPLLNNRPIVVGCSDRFDPDRPTEAMDLRNQLGRGWERFRQQVPDTIGHRLTNLDWLNSTNAHGEPFERYSGFQCYGEWLKPDEKSLENWQELVRSGIPLALWMNEGNPECNEIEVFFNHLIDSTRFEFLERIRSLRNQHRRTCNYCVGVFYEDLNYLPEIPLLPEEQLFVWSGA